MELLVTRCNLADFAGPALLVNAGIDAMWTVVLNHASFLHCTIIEDATVADTDAHWCRYTFKVLLGAISAYWRVPRALHAVSAGLLRAPDVKEGIGAT